MGGLLHLFDFNQSIMAKKFLTNKTHVGGTGVLVLLPFQTRYGLGNIFESYKIILNLTYGMEAPRNSLELPVGTSQSYYAVGDNVLLSYEVDQELSQKKCYPSEAPMKKLINEEISKRPNTRQNTPSVVARLMGMDMLPSDTKVVVQPIEKKNVNMKNNLWKKERTKKGSVGDVPLKSNSSKQLDFDPFHHNKDSCPDTLKVGKPRRREHPQEEELQMFKKEFEAWQAARFRECSRVVEVENIPTQVLAQQNLNKEKMAVYTTSAETETEKLVEVKDCTIKASSQETVGLQHDGYRLNLSPVEQNEYFPSRSRTINRDMEQLPMVSDQKLDRSFAPTRIVILKPGPDRIGNNEESWTCSSSTMEEKGSIEDFLEEVKERLKCELQGKNPKRNTVARGGGIETPFSEKPSDPKQIAQQIAKQVRENVTRDLGMNLPRSESTRSYRSETQFNGPGSPEFINRDTRRFLSERLRNVLKHETHMDIPVTVSGSSRSSLLDNNRSNLEQTGDTLRDGGRVSYWENARDGPETRSFRHGPDDDCMLDREVSSRNLIRSLSAPVSGTSFGKLLLEDRHVLTGVHIRRKLEDIENVSVGVKKQKKERFNIREKVSNFRYNFTLRGKLFGRKIQSDMEQPSIQHDFMKDIMSGPTVIMNFCDRPDNSTEVPPSPASVCSSAHEEFWRPAGYLLSPISTPDVLSREDNTMPQVFREISSNLTELRRQLNHLESDEYEDTPIKEEHVSDDMIELEDPTEAYIRDLLVASGLYDGSCDRSLSRWDPLAKPICNRVFEEVEESYRNMVKENEGTKEDLSKQKVGHKMLLDLLNEAISLVLGPPVTMSRFRRKIIGSSMLPPPRGRKLLNMLWETICLYVSPPPDKFCYLLDFIVARDLQSTPWSGLIDDEINDIGREVECQIVRDLIEEIVNDMLIQ